jgi:hypothetical protein
MPSTIQSTTVYQLRNGEDIIIPFCRLSITNDSYIPSTIRQWNNLDLSITNVGYIPHFKSELKKLSNSYSVNIPKYYSHGPRKLNIVRTQFRCSATLLNYDLLKVNIISNPPCSCGAIQEDSYHYFFECSVIYIEYDHGYVLLFTLKITTDMFCYLHWIWPRIYSVIYIEYDHGYVLLFTLNMTTVTFSNLHWIWPR